MPEAARVGDAHDCPLTDGHRPHRGGPVLAPASETVFTGHHAQARAGDACDCAGPPDFIVTGSSTVYVDGRPAARRGDHTLHAPGARVREGLGSVHIGGPTEGATLGSGPRGRHACVAAAQGRADGSTRQGWGNCGVESVRQLVNLRRAVGLTEAEMLNDTIGHHEAHSHNVRERHGASTAVQNVHTLLRHGVDAQVREMSFDEIVRAVVERRGVVTTHHARLLWEQRAEGSHAVLVTGVSFDAEGRLTHVVVNDTGRGACSDVVPAEVFARSLVPGSLTVVTDRPVW